MTGFSLILLARFFAVDLDSATSGRRLGFLNEPIMDHDAFLPPTMAERAEQIGVKKAMMPAAKSFILAVLAGAFIALGANFATVVTTGSREMPFGVARLLGGLAFCLGLVLVTVSGAELFTGNNLIVMAAANRKVSLPQLVQNWCIVYFGNLVGAMSTAAIVFVGEQHKFGAGQVGLNALNIAQSKCQIDFLPAVALGMLCNALVCLSVWMCLSARSTADKILSIVFPITAFVTAGFEHSVANMYFIPMGLFIRSYSDVAFWTSIVMSESDFAVVTWRAFVIDNLVPVSIGNVIGGAFMVGTVYWFVFLRGSLR